MRFVFQYVSILEGSATDTRCSSLLLEARNLPAFRQAAAVVVLLLLEVLPAVVVTPSLPRKKKRKRRRKSPMRIWASDCLTKWRTGNRVEMEPDIEKTPFTIVTYQLSLLNYTWR
jgi:hypothetical protein